MANTGLEHVERAADIHLEGRSGIVLAVEQPERRQMHDGVTAFEGLVQNVGLADVAAQFKDTAAGVAQRLFEIFPDPAAEVVEDADFGDRLLQEFFHDVRADQAGAADHQDALPLEVHQIHPPEAGTLPLTPTAVNRRAGGEEPRASSPHGRSDMVGPL